MGDMDVIHGEGTGISAIARQLRGVTGAQNAGSVELRGRRESAYKRHTDRNMTDIRAEFVK